MNTLDINNPNIPTIKSPEEKRQLELKKLVNGIIVSQLGPDIAKLDTMEPDAAWGEVGLIINKAVTAGLMFQAKKIQELEKEIADQTALVELKQVHKIAAEALAAIHRVSECDKERVEFATTKFKQINYIYHKSKVAYPSKEN